MEFLLDSADLMQARTCAKWGWVKGITTNPNILAKSDKSPLKTLEKLKEIIHGPIFYQLTADTKESMVTEAKQVHEVLKKKLVLKIPATTTGFEACAYLSGKYPCAITSIFSPAQALVANAAGAKYALYYHNRAKRLMKDGAGLAGALVHALKRSGTAVIAASLKSPEEVMEARGAGVKIMTTTFDVLKELTDNDLSNQAVLDFKNNGVGIYH